MKNIYANSAAIAAAGLMIIGSAASCFIVKANSNLSEICSENADNSNCHDASEKEYFIHDGFGSICSMLSLDAVKSPSSWTSSLPFWTEEMAKGPNKPIDNSTVQPGQFYIHKTIHSTGYDSNPVYRWIIIDDIDESKRFLGLKVRTVKYTEFEQSKSGKISLSTHQFDAGNSSFKLYAIHD